MSLLVGRGRKGRVKPHHVASWSGRFDDVFCTANIVSSKIHAHGAMPINSLVLERYVCGVAFGRLVIGSKTVGDKESPNAGQEMLLKLRDKVLLGVNSNQ
jgi:hypothetical protein